MRNDKTYLTHILDAIEKIEAYISNVTVSVDHQNIAQWLTLPGVVLQ